MGVLTLRRAPTWIEKPAASMSGQAAQVKSAESRPTRPEGDEGPGKVGRAAGPPGDICTRELHPSPRPAVRNRRWHATT